MLELVGSKRAYAVAVAKSVDTLALLLARGEWMSPQLDTYIQGQTPVFQERVAEKMASKRFLSCKTDTERRSTQADFAQTVLESMNCPLPVEILSERPKVPDWMGRIFAEAPNAFAIGRIAHICKHGSYLGPHYVLDSGSIIEEFAHCLRTFHCSFHPPH
ncbi:hypothetical protein [Achromobacter anxifer]|uniref:hypothetical protein n=1 Tax=Achromobacter anxifer TaxID=1287737 RepID=UPI0023F9285E|nr:hypothetical protein [Achromobacter anxifer]MDF8359417.1 hypothetical protein [Achromobacter anxifer]